MRRSAACPIPSPCGLSPTHGSTARARGICTCLAAQNPHSAATRKARPAYQRVDRYSIEESVSPLAHWPSLAFTQTALIAFALPAAVAAAAAKEKAGTVEKPGARDCGGRRGLYIWRRNCCTKGRIVDYGICALIAWGTRSTSCSSFRFRDLLDRLQDLLSHGSPYTCAPARVFVKKTIDILIARE
jgi:hypothetical protein